MTIEREQLTARTFVELADSLVDDFDVIDLLVMLVERCVELLDVATAGILVADGAGRLRVVATSSEQAEHLELFQIQNDEGPCLDSYRTGETVNVGQLGGESPWPGFSAESLRAGYPAVCAVPLRHRDQLLGCLNLFRSEPIALAEDDVHLGQALAAVASITMVQDEAARAAAVQQGQLQHALDSRVVIEQAKGMIAERLQVPMDQAFARLRGFARSTNRRLTETARALVEGSLDIDTVAGRARQAPLRAPSRARRPT